jgi:hypothetical protein
MARTEATVDTVELKRNPSSSQALLAVVGFGRGRAAVSISLLFPIEISSPVRANTKQLRERSICSMAPFQVPPSRIISELTIIGTQSKQSSVQVFT